MGGDFLGAEVNYLRTISYIVFVFTLIFLFSFGFIFALYRFNFIFLDQVLLAYEITIGEDVIFAFFLVVKIFSVLFTVIFNCFLF